jgi:hypothetical protein
VENIWFHEVEISWRQEIAKYLEALQVLFLAIYYKGDQTQGSERSDAWSTHEEANKFINSSSEFD